MFAGLISACITPPAAFECKNSKPLIKSNAILGKRLISSMWRATSGMTRNRLVKSSREPPVMASNTSDEFRRSRPWNGTMYTFAPERRWRCDRTRASWWNIFRASWRAGVLIANRSGVEEVLDFLLRGDDDDDDDDAGIVVVVFFGFAK
ncbi:uncharacterized protein MYCFIDRAFT_207825 [Pseudocercospora fijiensis CIRAD86]|uniref:Uncharacterized protein n=1 Tax=Pseudocercospora fijiensis (strain CIRAD86) TaxID=383855 RepID=M2Z120_PSEFD|nr:uncharacterized protein MYCFIDRAFT_207825 [Pseudocercospora fijiensis CIRAD86]EME83540.1 hypothetical protein MYCFIDRAFT_207825 [Pseudocercospora fijiensis CIRAD86]